MSSATNKHPANLDLCSGEIQNVKLQSIAGGPVNPGEAQIWYDSTAHLPRYYNGTVSKALGDAYTFSTGLTNSYNTISVTDYDKLLKNVATGSAATAAGTASVAATGSSAIAFGDTVYTYSRNTVAIGAAVQIGLQNEVSDNSVGSVGIGNVVNIYGTNCVAIGSSATTGDDTCIAIGSSASTGSATGAIQLGPGINGVDNTFTVGFPTENSTVNYLLLDGTTGKIPAERLPSYVDDVIETYIVSGATALSSGWLSTSSGGSALTPETGKIYVVLTSGDYQNKTYRWGGSTYVEIAPQKMYTFSTGLTNSSDTISVTDYNKLIKNTATGTSALGIASAQASGSSCTAIGGGSVCLGAGALAAGSGASAYEPYSVALGMGAEAGTSAHSNETGYNSAIQIGYGVNSTSGTLSVGFYKPDGSTNHNWRLLDGTTGLIPDARLSSNIPRKLTATNTALTASNGVCTWSVTNDLATKDVQVTVYEVGSTTNTVVYPAVEVGTSTITITLLSSSNISAGAYKVVAVG